MNAYDTAQQLRIYSQSSSDHQGAHSAAEPLPRACQGNFGKGSGGGAYTPGGGGGDAKHTSPYWKRTMLAVKLALLPVFAVYTCAQAAGLVEALHSTATIAFSRHSPRALFGQARSPSAAVAAAADARGTRCALRVRPRICSLRWAWCSAHSAHPRKA